MKTLILNRKIMLSIVTAMLLIYGVQGIGYVQAQNNVPELTPVSDRTPQVRDAIVTLVPGIDAADDVTAAHLALITNLNLSEKNITTLKAGDFDGLSALESLALYKNTLRTLPANIFSGLTSLNRLDLGNNELSSLSEDIFSGLTSLNWLSLSFNQLSSLPEDIFAELTSLRTLNLSYNQLSSLPEDLFTGPSALNTLNLSNNQLSSLHADIFDGLSSLHWLGLSFNELSSLPDGLFSGLASLRSFYLGDNVVDLSITVSLAQIGENQFKAIAPAGAPFSIVLPVRVTNGSIDGGATTVTIPAGSVQSEPLTVTRTPGTADAITVAIGTLPELPTSHYGYSLIKPNDDANILSFALGIPKPTGDPDVNHAPIFTEGSEASRTIAENTPAGRNIGSPVTATDLDEDILTYTLSGADAASFGIVSTTGQLQTRDPLDYEQKNAYAVTVTVSDGSAIDTISVAINVTDVAENNPPVFTEGESTERSIAENTPAGRNIGSPVTATDLDEDTLTYSLAGVDAASFGIVSTTGQLRTRAPLDYEQKNTYSVAVNVSDGNGGTDTIGVAINVTDVAENNAPVFVEGSATERSVAENTPAGRNIGSPVSATDLDEDTLTYSLAGVDAASFGIVGTTGQLRTRAPLDYEQKNIYSVAVNVSDGNGGTDTIGVTINVTDVAENNAPVFVERSATERSIPENTPAGRNIGAPIRATDLDEDTLTYSLAGVDAASFGIVGTTGQLRTRAPLDYEQKNTYSVAVNVSDGNGGTDTIGVAINVTDIDETPTAHAPVFIEGSSTERSVAENTPAGRNIGAPVTATDEDEDVLTYTLSGADAASFGIVSTTGQLRTRAPLDYEQKNAYAVIVTASDGTLTDTISVAINVTDVAENNAPVFVEGSSTERSVAENTPTGRNIGAPVTATDLDEDTLTYSLAGVDAASFGIVSTTGQLRTRAPLDYEQKNVYSVAVNVSDGNGGTDSIGVAINVTDVVEKIPDVAENSAPVFANDRTTRSIPENTPVGRNIGEVVSAEDTDSDDTLTYTLGGIDAAAFSIVGTTGQLQTRAPLDYETKNAYAVIVTVSDGRRTDTITVIITVIDVDETTFGGGTATRSIAENTPAGVNIGAPVSATDIDSEDVLIYSLEGPDAAAFTIVGITGQLKTRAPLDYETKNTYTLTVIVTDGILTASIIVTITIIDVDESAPPALIENEVTISEIMYGADDFLNSKPQWIELHNASTETISLRGWKVLIHNKNSPDLKKKHVRVTITFADSFFGEVPTLYPNETVLITTSEESKSKNSTNLSKEQIYDLQWETKLPLGLFDTILSVEAFYIELIDNEGTLVDTAGNFDGETQLWRFNLGHRGKTRDGHRSSVIRRYVNGVALDGTKKGSWIAAVDANLTADQLTYYGDKTDISTPGIGIVVNEIDSQFATYDANQDGVVNILDLVFIAGRFGESGPNAADVNGDGVVNVQDLILVAGALGQTQAAPSLHPTSLAMFTTADIQKWLAEAEGLDLTDPKLQSGLRFLAQLLAVLVPKETALLPNYPNPFNPETWIPYRLAEDAFVTLTIYDQRGRVVRSLDLGHQAAGFYEHRSQAIYWDGRNAIGERVASGLYFYTLTAGDYATTRKILILK